MCEFILSGFIIRLEIASAIAIIFLFEKYKMEIFMLLYFHCQWIYIGKLNVSVITIEKHATINLFRLLSFIFK